MYPTKGDFILLNTESKLLFDLEKITGPCRQDMLIKVDVIAVDLTKLFACGKIDFNLTVSDGMEEKITFVYIYHKIGVG